MFPNEIIEHIAGFDYVACAKLAQTCRQYIKACWPILEAFEANVPIVDISEFTDLRDLFFSDPWGWTKIKARYTRNTINMYDLDGKAKGVIYVKRFAEKLLVHRDGDWPAIIDNMAGLLEWRIAGKTHRDGDKPAVINIGNSLHIYPRDRQINHKRVTLFIACGCREWWVNGKRHRDNNKPAIVDVCSVCRGAWLCSRPTMVHTCNVSREWWVDGVRLR